MFNPINKNTMEKYDGIENLGYYNGLAYELTDSERDKMVNAFKDLNESYEFQLERVKRLREKAETQAKEIEELKSELKLAKDFRRPTTLEQTALYNHANQVTQLKERVKTIDDNWQPEKFNKDFLMNHVKRLKGTDGEGWHIGNLIEKLLTK